jgi:hypothetical protein
VCVCVSVCVVHGKGVRMRIQHTARKATQRTRAGTHAQAHTHARTHAHTHTHRRTTARTQQHTCPRARRG